MQKFRKLLVAVAGVALIVAGDFFDIKLPFGPEQLVDQVIALATAFGVWAVPNAA